MNGNKFVDVVSKYVSQIGDWEIKEQTPEDFNAGVVVIKTERPVPDEMKAEMRKVISATWNVRYEGLK